MSFGKFLDSKSAAITPGSTAPSSSGSSYGQSPRTLETYIAAGVKIAGVVSIQGDARIEGDIEGEIHCFGELVVSKKSAITGNIFSVSAIIEGTVQGDILAEKRIALLSPASVTGSVSAPSISMEDGVHFEGECIMKGSPITPSAGSEDDSLNETTASAAVAEVMELNRIK